MKPLLQWLSPAGPRARLSILIFHRVLPAPDPLFPDEVDGAAFDRLCAWVKQWFQVLPLDEAAVRLRSGSLPARALSITFDDGYRDNHDVALPILQRHGLPATFFIATGFLDGGRMWNDTLIEAVRRAPAAQWDLAGVGEGQLGRLALGETADRAARRAALRTLLPAAKHLEPVARQRLVDHVAGLAVKAGCKLPEDLMMTCAQVQALRDAGMQVGAHTVNHPILALLDEAKAKREIIESRDTLQQLLGEPVRLFAYPNGVPGQDYGAREVALVQAAGFDTAVSTRWGASTRHTPRFELPRFTPWDRTPTRFAARMARNLWSHDAAAQAAAH